VPTYWIAAIVVFFVFLYPMFRLMCITLLWDPKKQDEATFAVMFAMLCSLALAIFWPLTIVGTVFYFCVRGLEDVRIK